MNYRYTIGGNTVYNVYLSERNLYGSSRLGQEQVNMGLTQAAPFNYSGMLDNAYGDKRYELSNHLGNVLQVITDRKLPENDGTNHVAHYTADVVSYSDYFPYGMQMPGRNGGTDQMRYGFNGMQKDDEIKTHTGTSYDFGARMYDPRVGRFLSLDAYAASLPYLSPYNFASNSPIFKLDPDGNWDVEVHVYKDRSKYGYGIAIVKDNDGNVVQTFKVRVEGTGGRDRMVTNSDTPLGVYDIPNKDMWISGGARKSYGPNHRLVLNGESGEIAESGRSEIRIHGGRQETFNVETQKWEKNANPKLGKTHGCLRSFDDDIKEMKVITDKLQKNDPTEEGGKLIIVDDLEYINGQYVIPAKATPKTDQEKPKPIAAPTKKTSNTKSEKSFWDKAWEFIKSFDDGSRLGT